MDRRLIAALKALTDATRLRIVVELAEHDASVEELAARVGVAPSAAARHLRRLRSAGIVEASGRWPNARYRLRPERLGELGRALDEAGRDAAEPQPGLEPPAGRELDADEARVLSGFFDEDGRLTTIPAHSSKRLLVLRYLRDRCFPEDRAYPEKEVNQRLAVVHPDAASLRRYLVDAGLMRRAAGIYHRAE
jgi:DNA-binding transcriptional ArsR family regulator